MNDLPLAGIRIADFTWVWAGPYSTLLLSTMGAEVIKFESRKRLDLNRTIRPFAYADPTVHANFVEWLGAGALEGKPFAHGRPGPNQADHFNQLNMSKLGITLDLSHPKSRNIIRSVVALSDVVIENYSPRVMKGLGLDYDALREVRPDLIYLAMSGLGAVGPDRDFVLYGGAQVAIGGLSSLTGYIGGPPLTLPIGYGDPLAAMHAAFCILAALEHRRVTGEGQYIDMSQLESMINLIPEGMMEYLMNDRIPSRMGNRDAIMAPHDVFPCKGDDKWIAIAVGSEAEWRALCSAMGNPAWTGLAVFADMYSRWQHQDTLGKYLGQWTANFEAYELMSLLQQAGVAATPSLSNAEIVHDPHLWERNFFVNIDHPATGPGIQPSPGIHLSETPAHFFRAPLLGEHNQRVFGELLGITTDEIESLVEEKVIF
ncbi:MAG: CoA transferase [Dehalococcoidia bacterium]|nr:CoA transferase [Dehalococcoidia bacterium]